MAKPCGLLDVPSETLAVILGYLPLRDFVRVQSVSTAFSQLARHVPASTLRGWVLSHPLLCKLPELEPVEYTYDGFEAHACWYVRDMLHLAIPVQHDYPESDLRRVGELQSFYPWMDYSRYSGRNLDRRIQYELKNAERQAAKRQTNDAEAIQLLRGMLRGADCELLYLAERLGCTVQVWPRITRPNGESFFPEGRTYGWQSMHLDGMSDDVKIPHHRLGLSHGSNGMEWVTIEYDEYEEECPITPFLSLSGSRSDIHRRLALHHASPVPDAPSAPPTYKLERMDVSNSKVEVVDMPMYPGTGVYTAEFEWVTVQTAAACIALLFDPLEAIETPNPLEDKDETCTMDPRCGRLTGSGLYQVVVWSQYGGLGGTKLDSLGGYTVLEQYPVRGYSQYSSAGRASRIAMTYDSDNGKVSFVVDGAVQPQSLPVSGIRCARFLVIGGSGDKAELTAVEHP